MPAGSAGIAQVVAVAAKLACGRTPTSRATAIEAQHMSGRCCTLQSGLAALAIFAAWPGVAFGQAARPAAASQAGTSAAGQAQTANEAAAPDSILLSAIRTNPLTAPYLISVKRQKNGVIVLSGRVGTKIVHDAAVRMAIDLGAPFRDDLVIDTAAADQVALMASANAASAGALAPGSLATSPYIYPQPLMGRLDDPFFGMVPPILSFPPWWRRNQPSFVMETRAAVNANAAAPSMTAQTTGASPAARGAAPAPPSEPSPPIGQVEIRVDALGQVFLRGVVASDEVRRAIEETARSVPGVTRVDSQFQVQPRRADGEMPPPPPEPMRAPAGAEPKTPLPPAPANPPKAKVLDSAPRAVDRSGLSQRVTAALARRPVAAVLPIKVRSTDGVVTLSGPVPSAYEAMVAYRAAQQTPGVKEIVDQLEFPVPDEDHPNPLVHRGRPEDVEPYLACQIRRHFGDIAQLDRIQARGNLLELHATVENPDDKDRVLAILRSMPLLTGFRIEPVFTSD
jgi:hypothetical protein